MVVTRSCCLCRALSVGVTPPAKRLSKPSPALAWKKRLQKEIGSELNFHLLSFTQFHLLDQLIPIGIHFHVLDTAMMEMGYFSISPSSRFFQCSQAID